MTMTPRLLAAARMGALSRLDQSALRWSSNVSGATEVCVMYH